MLAHLWQARRNEKLAKQLLHDLDYKEWAVTVTFYSGLHYVEASFTQIPTIGHSETSMPTSWNKSIHSWRENLIISNFPSIHSNYRKLQNSSMIARYLSSSTIPSLDRPAEDFFDKTDVDNFINRDLGKIKNKLGIAT